MVKIGVRGGKIGVCGTPCRKGRREEGRKETKRGVVKQLGGFTKRPVDFDAARGIVARAKRGLNMTRHSGSH